MHTANTAGGQKWPSRIQMHSLSLSHPRSWLEAGGAGELRAEGRGAWWRGRKGRMTLVKLSRKGRNQGCRKKRV